MSYLILTIAAAALAAARARYVWTHPHGPHWRCGGTGKNRGSTSRAWGHCPSARCSRGEVLRPSARLLYSVMGREAKLS